MPSKTPITPIRLPPDLKAKALKFVATVPGLTLNGLVIQLLESHVNMAAGKKSPITRRTPGGQRNQGAGGSAARVSVGSLREEPPASARERFDRAVDKAIALRNADLQKSYAEHVRAEAARIMPEQFEQELMQAKEAAKWARDTQEIWWHRSVSCKQTLDMIADSYRVLTSALHPDRAPEDRRGQFTKAMEAINLIKREADKAKRAF